MGANPIRVLLADDEPFLLSALADLIGSQEDLELVGTASDADGAIRLALTTRPQVALIDVRMPRGGGLRVLEELHASLPQTRILAHSAIDDRAVAVRMLKLGAIGYLVKGVSPAEVLAAIRSAARGQPALSAELMSGMVEDLASRLQKEEETTAERRSTTQRLRQAIAGTGRRMVFQPIVRLEDEDVVGYESLARFSIEPEQTPDLWFAEAARSGVGAELELACIHDSLASLIRLPPATYLSVNMSHGVAQSPAVRAALETADASRVVLEITEHEEVPDYDLLRESLAELRLLGARVAIDDAGSGFASLRHVLLIEPDFIKLDITLTRGIDADRRRRALGRGLISMAAELEIGVIAEGVETRQEHGTLRELGVIYGQGYLYGKPAPLDP